MKLVEIKCPNCDAVLNIENHQKKVVCEFCKTNFLLDDEIKVIRHLTANQISEEQEFINANTHLTKFKNYKEAYRIYKSLSHRYVDNKEVWLGLLRSLTHDFQYKISDSDFIDQYSIYWNNYKALASQDEISKYESLYNEYSSRKIKKEKVNPGDPQTEKCYVAVTIFGGLLGIHKFVQHKTKAGLLYLFTLGIFGIGYLYDVYVECTKWEISKQLRYSRYVLCFLFIMFGFKEAQYSWHLFLFYLLIAFLCLNFVWKLIKIDSVLWKMISIVITLGIAVANGSRSVPHYLQGKWIIIDSQSPITEMQIGSSGINIILDGKEYDFSAGYYKNLIYANDSEISYRIEYKEDIQKICLLEEDRCVSYYKKITEDK